MGEYKIDRLGHRGDGLTRDGVIVPRTLPGENVTGTLSGQVLEDMRIVDPSPSRVAAPCPHYKACGGCQLQHAGDDFVADWKVGIVRDALQRAGLSPDFRSIQTSPARSRRRVKLTARRTKSGALAGFFGRRSSILVDIQTCHIIGDNLQPAFQLARELAVIGASRKSEMAVHVTSSLDGLDVAVDNAKPSDRDTQAQLSDLVSKYRIARLSWNGDVILQEAPPRQALGGAQVVVPPGAFLQATEHGQRSLQACVSEIVGSARSVIDLFSGCGTFALDLAASCPVHAVEAEAEMLRALQDGANQSRLRHPVTTERRNLFKDPVLSEDLDSYEAIVIDPPRAGAQAQVAEIAKSTVPVVAAVSCDPGTFARDAKVLTDGGYALEWVQVVDQFRWSPHVELAASFRRPQMRRG